MTLRDALLHFRNQSFSNKDLSSILRTTPVGIIQTENDHLVCFNKQHKIRIPAVEFIKFIESKFGREFIVETLLKNNCCDIEIDNSFRNIVLKVKHLTTFQLIKIMIDYVKKHYRFSSLRKCYILSSVVYDDKLLTFIDDLLNGTLVEINCKYASFITLLLRVYNIDRMRDNQIIYETDDKVLIYSSTGNCLCKKKSAIINEVLK